MGPHHRRSGHFLARGGQRDRLRRLRRWQGVALNAATGAAKWAYTTGGQVFSSPAVANGTVYIGSNDGYVYALNAATGAKKWAYTPGANSYPSPAVANGVVYVDANGAIGALNAATGAAKWAATIGAPALSSPAVANGVVYVGTEFRDKVWAINAVTGREAQASHRRPYHTGCGRLPSSAASCSVPRSAA